MRKTARKTSSKRTKAAKKGPKKAASGKKGAASRRGISAAKRASTAKKGGLGSQDFFFEGETAAPNKTPIDIDILSALKQDHDSLREFIEILKDEKAGLEKKKHAFESFRPLLTSHSKAEEESVYRPCKEIDELRDTAFEGFEEHGIADQLMAKVAATEDDDQWKARAKVLAELVEHHIEEEESEFFKAIEKEVGSDERHEMSDNFIHLREASQRDRTPKNAGVLENA